ncbi:MAG: hypothetical protein FH753_03555 [Firmicutes bacterium]|nr:hypothetical protein [Bacillota bacterium]
MKYVIELLNDRSITLEKLAYLVKELRNDDENINFYIDSILNILSIKSIQDLIILGVIIDVYTENKLLPKELLTLLNNDSLFELDKLISLSVLNEFGAEAIINYSIISKSNTLKEILDNKNINKFLDDIICVIASAASIDLV